LECEAESASLGADLVTEELIDVFAVADVVDFNNFVIFSNFINDTVAFGPERHITREVSLQMLSKIRVFA
jgi:hypothetical protein